MWLRLSLVLYGELAVAQGLEGVGKVGGGQREIAAESDEDLDVPPVHGLDGRHDRHAGLAGRLETAHLAEALQELLGGLVVDPAGAVALHVAVAPDRAGAGAFAPDVAAKQQKVDDLADSVDAVLVLGDAEAPGDDDPLGRQIGPGQASDFVRGDA